jgi:hypothetical protein
VELLTAQQLEARGVAVDHHEGRLRLRVPASLGPAVTAAIEHRVPKLRHLPPPRGARWGQCDVCLDPLDAHRGGMCFLCVAARKRALERAGVAA